MTYQQVLVAMDNPEKDEGRISRIGSNSYHFAGDPSEADAPEVTKRVASELGLDHNQITAAPNHELVHDC